VSNVKEMIQIAFEYEVKIQQLSVALQQAQDKIKSLEAALASSQSANSGAKSDHKIKALTE
jgi:hypothetical protein